MAWSTLDAVEQPTPEQDRLRELTGMLDKAQGLRNKAAELAEDLDEFCERLDVYVDDEQYTEEQCSECGARSEEDQLRVSVFS